MTKMTNKEALNTLKQSAELCLHPSIGSIEGRSFWADEDGQKDLEETTARIGAAYKQLCQVIENADANADRVDAARKELEQALANSDGTADVNTVALVDAVERAINKFANDRLVYNDEGWADDGYLPVYNPHHEGLKTAHELAVAVASQHIVNMNYNPTSDFTLQEAQILAEAANGCCISEDETYKSYLIARTADHMHSTGAAERYKVNFNDFIAHLRSLSEDKAKMVVIKMSLFWYRTPQGNLIDGISGYQITDTTRRLREVGLIS